MKSLILYADAEVTYDGRAFSTLKRGNYLIIVKPDQSITIHGAAAKPLNYQNAKSKIELLIGDEAKEISKEYFNVELQAILWSSNRGEILVVGIHKTIHNYLLDDWTAAKIELHRSEDDLCCQIINDLSQLLPAVVGTPEREYRTPYGNVDITVIEPDVIHIIEVKRKIAAVSAGSQIARYAGYFRKKFKQHVVEYIMAPRFSKNIIDYAQEHNQQLITVDFESRTKLNEPKTVLE